MKQIDTSPIKNNKLEPYISCMDHTVSRETFSIFIDKKSELLVTTPRPFDDNLEQYYDSEEYISHTDSKRSVLDGVYQLVRKYTIKQKVKMINSFVNTGNNILDIGAGTGDFLKACKRNGWNITGIEPNNKAKEIASNKLHDTNSIHSGLDKLQSDKSAVNEYDVITMWHVLEHIPNLTEYLSVLKQFLKPNGTLIIAVPNYKSFDAIYYKEYWAAYDVPRHLWHFSQKAISQLFAQEEMKVIKTLPMRFDAFYVSLLSEKYKYGKNNFIKAFTIGLKSNLKAKTTSEYSSLVYVVKKA